MEPREVVTSFSQQYFSSDFLAVTCPLPSQVFYILFSLPGIPLFRLSNIFLLLFWDLAQMPALQSDLPWLPKGSVISLLCLYLWECSPHLSPSLWRQSQWTELSRLSRLEKITGQSVIFSSSFLLAWTSTLLAAITKADAHPPFFTYQFLPWVWATYTRLPVSPRPINPPQFPFLSLEAHNHFLNDLTLQPKFWSCDCLGSPSLPLEPHDLQPGIYHRRLLFSCSQPCSPPTSLQVLPWSLVNTALLLA